MKLNVWNDFPCVVCEIEQDGAVGRGEGLGVYYLDETVESMSGQLEAIATELAEGVNREDLLDLLPPGGARMAADAALWDLEAQLTGRTAWSMAGVAANPVETVFTIGLEDTPEQMAHKALAATDITLFKIKLGNDRPVERIAAIREARPDVRMVIDVNQGWNFDELQRYAPQMKSLGISMIEQPLPRGADEELEGYESPVPLCADESCLTTDEFEQADRRYQIINIKLDKTGGLTEALDLARLATSRGKDLMIGNMVGTSLGMAPGYVIAQLCRFVDLDGTLYLTSDREHPMTFDQGYMSRPESLLWG